MSVTRKKGSDKLPLIANNTTKTAVLLQRYDYIPIDYIKAQITGFDKSYFLDNPNLTFTPVFESKTTDCVRYYYNENENMKLKVFESGSIYFFGSIHKFSNHGEHNHNQFSQSDYLTTLERLKSIYGITPQDLRLIQLEYGVNVTPPIPTNEILNNLLQHKNRDFEQKISNDNGKYYQCEHANYILKVYNKGLQYGCQSDILRIEIKQTNWSANRRRGLITLHDFNECNKIAFLNDLLDKWTEVVFFDPTNKGVNRWDKYSNVNFWRELRAKSHTTQKKHRDRLMRVNETCGLNVQFLVFDEVVKSVNLSQGFRYSNLVQSQRFCRLTGVNITMQRKDSFLLSHGGLYYLLENDNKTFERIRKRFLSVGWLTSSIGVQVKEIAHNIRTKYNYRERKFLREQLTMFDPFGV
jgi:hypothetical protein